MISPILREKSPAMVEHLERLIQTFVRTYELEGNRVEAATLCEGATEFVRVLASSSKSASLHVDVGDDGVVLIEVRSK